MAGRVPMVSAADIGHLGPVVRRYVAHRTLQPADVDDVVQETLARLMAAAGRLEQTTLTAYALTTANNLLTTEWRRRGVEHRHLPRLLDLSELTDPDARLIAEDERRAVVEALASEPDDVRELLLSRYGEESPPPHARSDSARLARARARLRVDVALRYRRTSLPTARCRAVLVALSERDRRRQRELRAGHHLLACPTCASLADVVVRRERRLLAFVPPVVVSGCWRWLRRHPIHGAAGGATAAGAAVLTAVLVSGSPPPAPPSLCALTTAGRALIGSHLSARAEVTSVPANEGFFVSTCHSRRVWVHLQGRRESPIMVRAGDELALAGSVAPVNRVRLRRQGVPTRELAAVLTQQVELVCGFRDVRYVSAP